MRSIHLPYIPKASCQMASLKNVPCPYIRQNFRTGRRTVQNINDQTVPWFCAFDRNWTTEVVYTGQIHVLDIVAIWEQKIQDTVDWWTWNWLTIIIADLSSSTIFVGINLVIHILFGTRHIPIHSILNTCKCWQNNESISNKQGMNFWHTSPGFTVTKGGISGLGVARWSRLRSIALYRLGTYCQRLWIPYINDNRIQSMPVNAATDRLICAQTFCWFAGLPTRWVDELYFEILAHTKGSIWSPSPTITKTSHRCIHNLTWIKVGCATEFALVAIVELSRTFVVQHWRGIGISGLIRT